MALRLNIRKCTYLLPRLASCLMPITSPALLHSHATSFGFKEVPEEEKSRMVGDVFSSVASKYDIMNDIMSVGLHRLWKDRLVSKLSPFPGMQHLDVAGGTGDIAFRVLEAIHSLERQRISGVAVDEDAEDETRVFICDINPAMLDVGRRRAIAKGLGEARSLIWMEGDAEALKFEDASMDGYTIAFGIRNVTHIEKALSEAYSISSKLLLADFAEQRHILEVHATYNTWEASKLALLKLGVLRRGGRFLCLELSHVNIPGFRDLYDFYSFSVIPSVGEIVAGDRESYQYLVESIRKFPSQEKFATMIKEAGFEKVEYENLAGGVVAIHSGFKL